MFVYTRDPVWIEIMCSTKFLKPHGLLKFSLFLIYVIVASDAVRPDPLAGRSLVWQDEFNSFDKVEPFTWTFDTSPPGRYNNESQRYTNSGANTFIEDGKLVIEARKIENGGGFTSARLNTKGKFEFKYGFMEIRASLTSAKGLHSAFWLIPSEDVPPQAGAKSNEIHLMDFFSCGESSSQKIYSIIRTKDSTESRQYIIDIDSGKFSREYHNYQLEWDPDYIRIGVDGRFFHTYAKTPSWPFDRPAHLVIFVAVGGNDWAQACNTKGSLRQETNLKPQLQIDYVRVYSEKSCLTKNCEGPYPDYIECENRLTWLQGNWDKIGEISKKVYMSWGIGGNDFSRCPYQRYLYLTEHDSEFVPFCPDPCLP